MSEQPTSQPQQSNPSTPEDGNQPADHSLHLHITVNRRRFDEADGVRPLMTGREIAALIDIPAENAVVRLENGPDQREIGADETVEIHQGQKFLVTRKTVEGGHGRS
jgi:hypothetical protein